MRTITRQEALKRQSQTRPAATQGKREGPIPLVIAPRRVGLAAIDDVVHGARILRAPDFLSNAALAAGTNGVDTLVCALGGWMIPRAGTLDVRASFEAASSLRTILLEVDGRDDEAWIELWSRGVREPCRFKQRLARSSESVARKSALATELPTRLWGDTLCLACGETNIASLRRSGGPLRDPFGFGAFLRRSRPRVILNPCHTYMTRYEMRLKRLAYSRLAGGRAVLSVWNRDRGIKRQSKEPWFLAVDGRDRTHEIDEVGTHLPWLRLGVVDLALI